MVLPCSRQGPRKCNEVRLRHFICLCRYYICDKKLSALGWTEKTSWEAGLKKTIDWYLEHGFESRWVGDVERALAAHPKAQ